MGSTAGLKESKASSSKVDPYAVLRLGDVVHCTLASHSGGGSSASRPVWNHRFNFLLPSNQASLCPQVSKERGRRWGARGVEGSQEGGGKGGKDRKGQEVCGEECAHNGVDVVHVKIRRHP